MKLQPTSIPITVGARDSVRTRMVAPRGTISAAIIKRRTSPAVTNSGWANERLRTSLLLAPAGRHTQLAVATNQGLLVLFHRVVLLSAGQHVNLLLLPVMLNAA